MKLFKLLALSLCLYINAQSAGTPGLNYNYYEGTWSLLPDFNTLTPVKKGTSKNVSLDNRNKDLQYAFQWSGFITIPATGNYKFETFSDDGSKLFIGTTQVVNNDGEHAGQFVTGNISLNAGVYPITISYFQSYGGHIMEVYWSSNSGLSRQKIGDNVLTVNDPSLTGLNYSYYEGTWSTLPDFNTLTPVKRGLVDNVNLDSRTREMQYAFLWQGNITITTAGNYTFETYSDDGSKLYIGSFGYNTTPVVNNDGEHASRFVTGTVFLNAGIYPIAVTFFQSYGGQTMEIYWSSNTGVARQKIPNEAFRGTSPIVTLPVVTPPIVLVPEVPTPAIPTPVVTNPNTPTPTGTTFDATSITDGLKSATNNYYFSVAAGNDSRTPAQAMNPATPWKTINKLNAFMSSLQPGDAVLFNRGEVFDGSIVMAQSGTASRPIIFSAYGTGSKPVINGLMSLRNWVSTGNGTWEASCPSADYLNMVLFNDNVQAMGRFPNITEANRGYLTIDSHNGSSQLTDQQLGSSVNWKGAELVVRKNDWTIDRGPITNHSGNTLNFVSPTSHPLTDGYGYFIQNSPQALDQLGEWYYNPATKRLRVFFGSGAPTSYSVKASIVDTLVNINKRHYITFDNLAFRGGDFSSLVINNSSNVRVQNSDINYSGIDGLSAENSPYLTVSNSTFNHSNNSGMRLYQGSNYATIKGNVIINSGIIPGMGSSNNQQHDGIYVDSSPSNTIEYNRVDSSGYCGITFSGDHTVVKNNSVNYFCLTVNDGGGIYTWGGWDKTGRKVIGNVVMNGIGAPEGTDSPIAGGAVGIYTDDRSTNIDIMDNTVANCNRAGIYLHNSHEMNVKNNTLHNNTTQLSIVHDALEPGDPIRNINAQGNIISSSKAGQFLMENASTHNDIAQFGTYNNNYYMRPSDENGIINTNVMDNGQSKASYYDLAGWSAAFGYDQQSKKSPVTIPAYAVSRLIGGNKYANGSFNSNIDGVVCMSSPGRGTASLSKSKLDGGALQISFDALGGSGNQVGAYIDFGAVTAGKSYLIRFSLLGSSSGKTVKAFILQNGGSYGKLSELRYFELTSSRTENQFIFTAPSTQSNAMIALEMNGNDCPFWMDNFQVHEAEITTLNADDYMRFEYNNTGRSKSVTLNDTYVDATNKSYSGNITLAPFTSLILMKQPVVTAAQSDRVIEAVAAISADAQAETMMAMTVKVSPNPAHEKLQVSVNLPSGTQAASMSIFNLAGVKVRTMPLAAATAIVPVDVTTMANGVYIININYDGKVVTKKFVKQ